MNWFTNLKTRAKLLLAFGFILLLLVLVVGVAFQALKAVRLDYNVAADVARLESNINAQRGALLSMMHETDRAVLDAELATLKTRKELNSQIITALKEVARDNPGLLSRINEWVTQRDDYNKLRDEQIIPALLSGKVEEARGLVMGTQSDRYERMRTLGEEVSNLARADADSRVHDAMLTVITLGIVALLVGLVLVGVLNRLIAIPLGNISRAAEQIALGDLDVVTAMPGRTDEVGLLGASFDRMTTSLQVMARGAEQVASGDLTVAIQPQSAKDVVGNALATMVQQLSALISQVQKSGIQVTTSGTEIAATARQQQATASEISSTTTEIGATAKEISATAKELVKAMKSVTETAEETATLATSGQTGLTRMEATMMQIMEPPAPSTPGSLCSVRRRGTSTRWSPPSRRWRTRPTSSP
nr:HAMP domain-containing protein [Verrucomicrobium spinosum]